MRDGATNEPPTDWARLLREITSRPGWSVAKLARESGIHRSTIFRWLEGGEQKTVTVRSVNLIADAAGINRDAALRAAGAALEEDVANEDLAVELDLIDGSDLPQSTKEALKREARRMHARQAAERRALTERQAAERRENIQTWIEIAGGTQPAT
jgi:transcriptional regulator with XRE-family HTH domain